MSREAVEIETQVLMALDHEAIIKLYDAFETKTNMTLVMELYVPNSISRVPHEANQKEMLLILLQYVLTSINFVKHSIMRKDSFNM